MAWYDYVGGAAEGLGSAAGVAYDRLRDKRTDFLKDAEEARAERELFSREAQETRMGTESAAQIAQWEHERKIKDAEEARAASGEVRTQTAEDERLIEAQRERIYEHIIREMGDEIGPDFYFAAKDPFAAEAQTARIAGYDAERPTQVRVTLPQEVLEGAYRAKADREASEFGRYMQNYLRTLEPGAPVNEEALRRMARDAGQPSESIHPFLSRERQLEIASEDARTDVSYLIAIQARELEREMGAITNELAVLDQIISQISPEERQVSVKNLLEKTNALRRHYQNFTSSGATSLYPGPLPPDIKQSD